MTRSEATKDLEATHLARELACTALALAQEADHPELERLLSEAIAEAERLLGGTSHHALQ